MFDSHFIARKKGCLATPNHIRGDGVIDNPFPLDQILSRTHLAMTQKEYQTTGDRNKKHKPLIEIDPKERNII